MILDGCSQRFAGVGFAQRLVGKFGQRGFVLAQRVGKFHDRHAILAERPFNDIEVGDGGR